MLEGVFIILIMGFVIVVGSAIFVVWGIAQIARAIARVCSPRRPTLLRGEGGQQRCGNVDCRYENPPGRSILPAMWPFASGALDGAADHGGRVSAAQAFAPNLPPLRRPSHGELLGRFVPTAMRRMPAVARFVHPLRLALLGFITAGLLPCRMLQRRVYRVQMMYAHQAELAGELLSLHAAPADQSLIQRVGRGVRVSRWSGQLSAVLLTAALAVGIAYVVSPHRHYAAVELWLHPLKHHVRLGELFIGLIGGAYLLLIIQIDRQIAAMQRLAIAASECVGNLPPVAAPPLVFLGRSPLTLLLGLTLAWIGLPWALPMAIAWSAFVQFVRGSAYTFHVDLAERLQAVSGTPPVIDTRDLCPNPHCRHQIPGGATFCPRCGAAVGEVATVVAGAPVDAGALR